MLSFFITKNFYSKQIINICRRLKNAKGKTPRNTNMCKPVDSQTIYSKMGSKSLSLQKKNLSNMSDVDFEESRRRIFKEN